METSNWDVIVVGSGAAGLCAAIEAHDGGARVLVLESQDAPGGSSRISGGMMLAAGTPLQARHGITDDADAFYHDYLLHTQWKVVASSARRIADDSAATISWLEGLGVEFYDFLSDAGYDGVPRTHSAVGRGAGVIEPLLERVAERGIEIRCGHRVGRLLAEDGRVVGVEANGTELRPGSGGPMPSQPTCTTGVVAHSPPAPQVPSSVGTQLSPARGPPAQRNPPQPGWSSPKAPM